MITILSCCGTGESSSPTATTTKQSGLTVDSNWGGFAWQVAQGVNQNAFTPVQIPYPAQGFLLGSPISYLTSIGIGVTAGTNIIKNLTEEFVLVGYSQGAQVISLLLQSLQSGALASKMPQLLAGITFGNPMRQSGHTFPNDPTGATGIGINWTGSTGVLSGTPTKWWDMTNTYDLAGNVPNSASGLIINDIWGAAGQVNLVSVPQIVTALMTVAQQQTDFLSNLITSFLGTGLTGGSNLTAAIAYLVNASMDAGTFGHTSFGAAEVGNTGMTFVQTAIAYLNSLAN